jgi:hypothetical protein
LHVRPPTRRGRRACAGPDEKTATETENAHMTADMRMLDIVAPGACMMNAREFYSSSARELIRRNPRTIPMNTLIAEQDDSNLYAPWLQRAPNT